MPPAPFDTVAAEYDARFTEHALGRWLRAAVWAHLDEAFQPGDSVLELGCGTGEDAVHLARRGVRVHATDGAAAMVEIARHKALLQGIGDGVTFSQLDLNRLDISTPLHVPISKHNKKGLSSRPNPRAGGGSGEISSPEAFFHRGDPSTPLRSARDDTVDRYDGAFSNFGALNSLPDRHALAEALARWIRPGGRLVLVIMGPWCPWEWGWYLARGRARTAFRRFRSGGLAHVGDGATMRVWYPSPRRVRRELAPYFRHRQTTGLGVLLPPTFAQHLVDRWPAFFEHLAALDQRAGRVFPGTWLNDHYLTIFERTELEIKEKLPSSSSFSKSTLQRSESSSPPGDDRIKYACPQCRSALERVAPDGLRCTNDGLTFSREDGIWHFLTPERTAHFEQFIHEYTTIRRAEGRGDDDPAYFRALPFDARTGRHRRDWQIRARSYRAFVEGVLEPLETRRDRPLAILDLGAGNGWLSYRLAQRGHQLAALDLQTNDFDGLGAHRHYDADFASVQAEFDHLPFAGHQFDVAIFNASLHYATDYSVVLREALRVLKPEGRLTILDSPVYRDGLSGAQMVREREAAFEKTYGFASNALASENYLTDDRLGELAASLDLRWQIIAPFYGWRWAARPWIARLLRRREPARFLIITGNRVRENP